MTARIERSSDGAEVCVVLCMTKEQYMYFRFGRSAAPDMQRALREAEEREAQDAD